MDWCPSFRSFYYELYFQFVQHGSSLICYVYRLFIFHGLLKVDEWYRIQKGCVWYSDYFSWVSIIALILFDEKKRIQTSDHIQGSQKIHSHRKKLSWWILLNLSVQHYPEIVRWIPKVTKLLRYIAIGCAWFQANS